jgi:hypothetical protein
MVDDDGRLRKCIRKVGELGQLVMEYTSIEPPNSTVRKRDAKALYCAIRRECRPGRRVAEARLPPAVKGERHEDDPAQAAPWPALDFPTA